MKKIIIKLQRLQQYIIFFIFFIFISVYNNKKYKGGLYLNNKINDFIKEFDIYYINLNKCKKRREYFNKSTNKIKKIYSNYNVNRFSAINGNNIEKNEIDNIHNICKKKKLQTLKPGQIGCSLSHYNIWKKKNIDKYLLILEDDITININIINKLYNIFPELPDDWDILLIGWRPFFKSDKRRLKYIHKYNKNISISKHIDKTILPFHGTHGYIVNNNFIKKMNKYITSKETCVPTDDFLFKLNKNGCSGLEFKDKCLNIYNLKKPLINSYKSISHTSNINSNAEC